MVSDGKVVLTKTYGKGELNKAYVYASISKVVTGMIIMQLLEEGKIESLDDNIWKYSPRYKNCMPKKYADSPLTIRHILLFKSGIPHNNSPTWKNGKLNLKFKPGAQTLYSTPSFGVLGHIIEDITGKSYHQAVKTYTGKPVGASSFWAEKVFKAPGARIHSSIEDMTLFATGMINHKYISQDMLYNRVIKRKKGSGWIIWPVRNAGTPDVELLASGSNGIPQAFMIIKLEKKLAAVVLAHTRDKKSFEIVRLAQDIFSILERNAYNKNKKE